MPIVGPAKNLAHQPLKKWAPAFLSHLKIKGMRGLLYTQYACAGEHTCICVVNSIYIYNYIYSRWVPKRYLK